MRVGTYVPFATHISSAPLADAAASNASANYGMPSLRASVRTTAGGARIHVQPYRVTVLDANEYRYTSTAASIFAIDTKPSRALRMNLRP